MKKSELVFRTKFTSLLIIATAMLLLLGALAQFGEHLQISTVALVIVSLVVAASAFAAFAYCGRPIQAESADTAIKGVLSGKDFAVKPRLWSFGLALSTLALLALASLSLFPLTNGTWIKIVLALLAALSSVGFIALLRAPRPTLLFSASAITLVSRGETVSVSWRSIRSIALAQRKIIVLTINSESGNKMLAINPIYDSLPPVQMCRLIQNLRDLDQTR